MDEVWRKLAEPFPPGEVQWRVEALSRDKKRALVVPYVDARTVLDRLDKVVGPEGWHDAYEVLSDAERLVKDERGERRERLCEVKCRLTVLGVTKEDVGEGDSLKAAFSDALKRAAVKFGVGRYLYRLEKQWVDYDPEKGRFTPADAVAKSAPMEKSWAYPVVANGRLYLRDHATVWCYAVR